MDFEKVILQRKMIREYIANKQIPDELTHRAPSAGHTQVQELIIVKDSITKKKLRKVAVDQDCVELAPVLMQFPPPHHVDLLCYMSSCQKQ